MRRCSPIPPVVPPVSRFPRCAKPRKSVITVNGLSPDADGNVNAGDVRREDFSGVEPKEKMTLNEVGAKVNEVIGRLGVASDSAAASPRASGYGPGTPLGDVHPDTVLRDVVEAAGMSADGVRAIASEVVAPVAASVTDLQTSKLDKADVVDPAAATEDGKAADAKKTQEELDRISGVASDAKALAESKADKLSSRQLEAVNSGIDADKVANISQNEIAISDEVFRATTEESRLRELVNAIKTFDAVVADSLPVPSEQYRKKLYLVPSTNPETRNVKDEFICVNIADVWSWEQVGSTAITIEFDNEPTEGSQKAARSGGIWSWVKSLLPRWLTSDYAEPATVESVAKKADKPALPVTDGNLAALTADGNLKDSGKKTSDFLPASSPYTGIWDVYDETTFRSEFSVGPNGDILGVSYDHGSLYKFGNTRWFYGETASDANEIAVKGDVSGLQSSKADKIIPSKRGNLSALAEDGNLIDSFVDMQDLALKNQVNWMADQDSGFVSGHGDGLRFESGDGEQRLAVLKGRVIVDRDGKDAGERSVAMLGDINSATRGKADRASVAPEYSATSAYSVGSIVYHDGNIYQCKTAIADGGEAWNAEHWELRKLDDFFTESNSLLNGRLAYSRNETGLKDRAFNTLSFDGTEYNLSTALAAVTPTASGQPRDLLIVATATAATTISFTAGTIKGDKPTIDGSGTWLITLTEYASGVWYCRQIKMEDAA